MDTLEVGKLLLFKVNRYRKVLSRVWFIKSDGTYLLETLAANHYGWVRGSTFRFSSYTMADFGGYYETVEVVPVEDLPLFVSWPYKTVNFSKALKGVGNG